MDIWGKWWMGFASLVTLVVLAFVTLFFINLTQPRVYQGYYLRHFDNSAYKIKIAFDNREDATAFKTYNPIEALEVLERLQAAGNPTSK